jgi:hypothetical protein
MLVEVAGLTLLPCRLKGWRKLVVILWGVVLAPLTVKATDDPSLILRLVEGAEKIDTIVSALTQAVRQNPDDAQKWAWLGYALCLQGDWKSARQAYARARSLVAPFNLAWLPPQLPLEWLNDWRGVGQVNWVGKRLWCSAPTPTHPLAFSLPERHHPFSHLIAVYADDGKKLPVNGCDG